MRSPNTRNANLSVPPQAPGTPSCLWKPLVIIFQFAVITINLLFYLTNKSAIDLSRLENLETCGVRKDANPCDRKDDGASPHRTETNEACGSGSTHICECSHAHTIIRGAQRRKRVVSTWSMKGPETKGQCM